MKAFPAARFALLAACAALTALPVPHEGEDPGDGYVFDRSESVLHLSLEAPSGASLQSGYDSVALVASLHRHSWEVWRHSDNGDEQPRNAATVAESGAAVSLSLMPASGSLSETLLATDADGRAYATYTADGGWESVFVEASADDSTATLEIPAYDFGYTDPGTGDWTYSHTEATLVVELVASGSAMGRQPGEQVEMRLSARYETWDVHSHSFGEVRTENHTSAPAAGSSVSWILSRGDGYVSGQGEIDASGEAGAVLAMGHTDSLVRAELSFAGGHSTSAELYFTSAPSDPDTTDPGYTATHSHSETVNVLANLGVSNSSPYAGETVTVSGEVRAEVWDVWTGGTAGEERVYNYAGPDAGTAVNFMQTNGDGSLSASSAATDGSGWFSVPFTAGSSSAQIVATIEGSTPGDVLGSDIVGVHPLPGGGYPSGSGGGFLHYDGAARLEGPHADGPTYDLVPGASRVLSGTLSWESWEVWDDGQGRTFSQNGSATPLSHAPLEVRLAYGEGVLGEFPPGEAGPISVALVTGPNGEFALAFTMGELASRVEFLHQGTTVGHLDLSPPTVSTGAVWIYARDESSLFVTLEVESPAQPGDALEPGDTVPVHAFVTETTWEVWELRENGLLAGIDLRNTQTGPAINAPVSFAQHEGPGGFAGGQPTQVSTDIDGRATVAFVLGESSSRLGATAVFRGVAASGERLVSPDLWEYVGIEGDLLLSLEAEGSPADTLAVFLLYRSREIWRRAATGETEARAETVGPAVGARIDLASDGTAAMAFAQNPAHIGTDGLVRVAYSSTSSGNVVVAASFAGLEVTGAFEVPAGTSDVGTWTGAGGTGGTGGTGQGSGAGSGSGTGQVQNTTSGSGTNPPAPLPATALKGRKHYTNQPEHEVPITAGGSSETIRKFTVKFARQKYDENEEPLAPESKDVSGREEDWPTVQAAHANDTEGAWEVAAGPHFFDDVINEGGSGTTSSEYENFGVWGKPAPESGPVELDSITDADGMRAHAAEGTWVDAEEVHGALGISFANNGWSESTRSAAAEDGIADLPDLTAIASYTSGIAPSVTWAEFWLQAEQEVPKNGGPAEKTYLISAKRSTSGNMPPLRWYATVTLGVSGEKRVSTTAPTVTWLTPNAPTGWVVPDASGVVRLQPEVVRGLIHEVSLLPVEMKDIQGPSDEDDRPIQSMYPVPKQKQGESAGVYCQRLNTYYQQQVPDRSIAYIDPHRGANDSPDMPQLVAKIPGGPKGLKVRWRLEVDYLRGNGYRTRHFTAAMGSDYAHLNEQWGGEEDTIRIPIGTTEGQPNFTPVMNANEEWRIFEAWEAEITERGFFGGTAKLYVWFPDVQDEAPSDPIMTFRIGGKNPEPVKAKAYINEVVADIDSRLWFSYAIAKHETHGRVREDNVPRYYNQFYNQHQGGPIGDASVDMGWAGWAKAWPLYNLDRGRRKDRTRYQNGPGGYGIYQVTGTPKNSKEVIPRRQLWNWQNNVEAGVAIIREKAQFVDARYTKLQETYPAAGAIPTYPLAAVNNRRRLAGWDAYVVTGYNGFGGCIRVRINGFGNNRQWTCWDPQQGSWRFVHNVNRYCEKLYSLIEETE